MMKKKKYIVFLLIISLLVPSFVGIFWTSKSYAFSGLDDPQIKDGFYSVLKGLAMLFLLNKAIDKDEPAKNQSLGDSQGLPSGVGQGSGDTENKSPSQEPSQPSNEPSNSKDSNDSVDIIVEEPPTDEGNSDVKNDWTDMKVDGLTAAEKKMLDLLNQERKERGLEPLKADLRLVKVARAKSRDMIENDYFDHQSPTLGSPFDMMKKVDIYYTFAGENIAGAPTVQQAHEALMDSKGHRENILRPRFTHVGIGIIEGSKYGMMFSQEFIDLD